MLRFFGIEPIDPIMQAVLKNDLNQLECLIATKHDPNQPDNNGNTPLHIAIIYHQDTAVQCLLNHPRIKINYSNKTGFTPLHLAVLKNKLSICEQLLKKKARPNVRTHAGYTPFFLATLPQYFEIAILLLNIGANYKIPNHAYITPMYAAAQHGNDKLIAVMLERGADPSSRANYDFSPKYVAWRNSHHRIAKMIEQHQVKKRQALLAFNTHNVPQSVQSPLRSHSLNQTELAPQKTKRAVFEIERKETYENKKRFKGLF